MPKTSNNKRKKAEKNNRKDTSRSTKELCNLIDFSEDYDDEKSYDHDDLALGASSDLLLKGFSDDDLDDEEDICDDAKEEIPFYDLGGYQTEESVQRLINAALNKND